MRVTRHHSCRVSPFGHPRIHARLAAPRGLSQPPTSFIGSQCQGIHHAPLNTYKHKTNKSEIAHQHTKQPPTRKPATISRARCSQPLSTNQTPHPTTKDGATTRPPEAAAPRRTGLLSQSPIVCSVIPAPAHPADNHVRRAPNPTPLQRTDSSRPTPTPTADVSRGAP